MSATQAVLAPMVPPMPDPPTGEAFTPEQWTTLLAIMDTIVPSIKRGQTISDAEYSQLTAHLKKTVVEAPEGAALDEFLEEKPSDNPRFCALLKRSLVLYSREDVRKNLLFILWALK